MSALPHSNNHHHLNQHHRSHRHSHDLGWRDYFKPKNRKILFSCFWTFVPDYVAVAVIFGLVGFMELFIVPFHRMFYLDDKSIQYPHALAERVSVGESLLSHIAVFSILTTISLQSGS